MSFMHYRLRFNKLISFVALLLFITLLIVSCDQPARYKFHQFDESKSYNISNIDTITQPPGNFINRGKVFECNDTIYCYFFDKGTSKLLVFNLNKSSLLFKLDFSNLSGYITLGNRTEIHFLHRDTLAIFSNNDQKLILINRKGEIFREIQTEDSCFIYTGVSVSFSDRSFVFNKNKFYFIYAYSDIILNSKEKFLKYYARPLELIIDISEDTPEYYHSLIAPSNYLQGNFYCDFEYFKCIGKDNITVHSFPSNDSLFIYQDTTFIRSVYAGSKYCPDFVPFDIAKTHDIALTRRCSRTSPFYQKIVYDPYRNVYLRAFKRESSYTNENGEIRRNNELPWSIVILSENFEILGEIDMDPAKYSMYTILPISKGILVSQALEKSLKENTLKYYLLTVE